MKQFIIAKQRVFAIALVVLGLLVLVALPPLLFAPDIKDKDFPHSGVVVRMTDTGFVLGGKRNGRELTVTTTASTTIKSPVTVGAFVQVFGPMTSRGVVASLALAGYSYRRIIVPLYLGNIGYNIALGYLGYYAYDWIVWLLG